MHRGRLETVVRWICAALALYLSWLGAAYYFHIDGIARHHLESVWFWFAASAAVAALTSLVRITAAEPARPLAGSLTAVLFTAFAAIAIAIYLPALRLGFLSDDFVLARIASRGELVGPAWSFVRPLPTHCSERLRPGHPGSTSSLCFCTPRTHL